MPGEAVELTDFRMNDGWRKFASLPMTVYPRTLMAHIASLPGAVVTHLIDAMPIDGSWIDFEFGGHRFSATDQYGEFWFMVEDPRCPDETLRTVIEHCAQPFEPR